MATKGEAHSAATVVHKVLNNNVVISIDESGAERVLMGRGIGFGLKPSDTIDPASVEKTFVLDPGSDGDHARQVLTDVPFDVIEAVTRAVDGAERMLRHSLGRRFTMAVIDHIQYVRERLAQGIRIPTTSMPELRILYPAEFAAAAEMAESIETALAMQLPDEEAVFLTMHVLNATRDEPNGTAAQLFRRVQHVVVTVENGLGVRVDPGSNDYARFILHIQFLLQRLVTRTMLDSADTSFFEFAKRSYPRSFTIAEDIKAYVREATGSALTNEEVLYLIVHVERLAQHVTGSADSTAAPTV